MRINSAVLQVCEYIFMNQSLKSNYEIDKIDDL